MNHDITGPYDTPRPHSPMTLDEYQRLSRRTMNTENQDFEAQASNAALGLAGEAGEVADLIKKHLYHGRSVPPATVMEELGDVLFYVTWLAQLAGSSLEEVAQMNVMKLAARYPDGFKKEGA